MVQAGGYVIQFNLIVAMETAKRGIGIDGGLPWASLSEDMQRFKKLTLGHAVLMGRKTYESLPPKVRPLPGRTNIVLTRDADSFRQREDVNDSVLVAGSFEAAEELIRCNGLKTVFVIGGSQIYEEALARERWSSRIYLTEVEGNLQSDVFFPKLADDQWGKISVSDRRVHDDLGYRFVEYVRSTKNVVAEEAVSPTVGKDIHEEMQYLELVRRIIETGNEKGDRTGTGTRSVFGAQMRFNLRESFPLLTTKRVFWRGVAEELIWFLQGSTDGKLLSNKNVHIWDGNGSREFLDKLGFHDRREGDLGPVYGFQWRHFGAEYEGPDADYSGKGVDQLKMCIETIKTNPNDRRIIMSAWNPADLSEMALPPCHMFCQFYVANGELSCQMYQRSCDMGLGIPFNIASYALLTYMVAHECNLKPGDFVHTLGDAHVYNNHIEALKVQIERDPLPFPKLEILDRSDRHGIEDYTLADFKLHNYECHPPIKMEMAV